MNINQSFLDKDTGIKIHLMVYQATHQYRQPNHYQSELREIWRKLVSKDTSGVLSSSI